MSLKRKSVLIYIFVKVTVNPFFNFKTCEASKVNYPNYKNPGKVSILLKLRVMVLL